jgi:hypothetical protein
VVGAFSVFGLLRDEFALEIRSCFCCRWNSRKSKQEKETKKNEFLALFHSGISENRILCKWEFVQIECCANRILRKWDFVQMDICKLDFAQIGFFANGILCK